MDGYTFHQLLRLVKRKRVNDAVDSLRMYQACAYAQQAANGEKDGPQKYIDELTQTIEGPKKASMKDIIKAFKSAGVEVKKNV